MQNSQTWYGLYRNQPGIDPDAPDVAGFIAIYNNWVKTVVTGARANVQAQMNTLINSWTGGAAAVQVQLGSEFLTKPRLTNSSNEFTANSAISAWLKSSQNPPVGTPWVPTN